MNFIVFKIWVFRKNLLFIYLVTTVNIITVFVTLSRIHILSSILLVVLELTSSV